MKAAYRLLQKVAEEESTGSTIDLEHEVEALREAYSALHTAYEERRALRLESGEWFPQWVGLHFYTWNFMTAPRLRRCVECVARYEGRQMRLSFDPKQRLPLRHIGRWDS